MNQCHSRRLCTWDPDCQSTPPDFTTSHTNGFHAQTLSQTAMSEWVWERCLGGTFEEPHKDRACRKCLDDNLAGQSSLHLKLAGFSSLTLIPFEDKALSYLFMQLPVWNAFTQLKQLAGVYLLWYPGVSEWQLNSSQLEQPFPHLWLEASRWELGGTCKHEHF